MVRTAKRVSVLLLTPLVMGQGLSGSASAASSDALSGSQRVAGVLSRVEDARHLIAGGGIADGIRAAAALDNVDLRQVRSAPTPLLDELPGGIAAGVAQLVGAVQIAGSIVAEASDPRAAAVAREMLDLAGRIGHTTPDGLAARLASLKTEAARGIDMDAFASAALHVAEAIDNALTVLRPIDPLRAAADCDIAEQADLLCIGGDGPNIYTKDYAVLIDLGGDDVYTNRAGAGFTFHPANFAPGPPVSVNLDLGGNDRYEREPPEGPLADISQGAAFYGIGMLVDASGNDVYSIRTEPMGSNIRTQHRTQHLQAQGYALLGVGVMADLAGDDSYTIEHRTQGFIQARAYSGGGMALFMDPSGNDTHLLEGRPETVQRDNGAISSGTSQIIGYGAGGGPSALFYDGGGKDSLTAISAPQPIHEDDPRPVHRDTGSAQPMGFGWGVIGTAAAIFGEGDTTRRLIAATAGQKANQAFVMGFGQGLIEGAGVLYDEGGDDVNEAVATVRTAHRVMVDDACGCAGVRADGSVSASVEVQAQGVGSLGGVGILEDAAGDDTYVASATRTSVAEATDARTSPSEPGQGEIEGAQAVAGQGHASVLAQGAGWAGVIAAVVLQVPTPGAGLLLDRAGDDTYEAIASADATARASSELSPDVARTEIVPGKSVVNAQGAGLGAVVFGQEVGVAYGGLKDLGGRDEYRTSSSRSAESDPPAPDVEEEGVTNASAQGSVVANAIAFFLDDGSEPDVFELSPADPACEGTRGSGRWRDCGVGLGIGLNPA